jgi:hypothetical protein
MRTAAGWADACILNISSRGMLLRSGQPPELGQTVELRHRDCIIVACVVWRSGAKAGLRAEDCLPVDRILSLSAADLAAPVAEAQAGERRKRPRSHDDNRLRGRAIEFAGVATVAAFLAGAAVLLVQQALARPMAYVEAALSADSR